MVVHALLGATGNLGSAILRCLLSSHWQIPDLRINILVRSKSKLLQAFPQLMSTSSATITIFEGSISDKNTLKACINGASTIYVCVATNCASRKVDIAVTTAERLVAALGQLRKDQESEYNTPVLLFNRSMALNSDVQLPVLHLIKRFTVFAIWYIYEDLLKAGAVYAGAEKDGLLTCVTADGPGLMGPNRTKATGYKLMERGKASAALNYADFGIAMVELGQRHEEFGGKVVGISAIGTVQIDVLANIWIILLGLKSRLIPF